jgi:hypothetical protein
MKLLKFVLALISFLVLSSGLRAGDDGSQHLDMSAPVVPAEIVAAGRQAVTAYLLESIDSAYVSYRGASLLNQGRPNFHFLDREDLAERGYKTPGSFTEFSAAISGLGSRVQLTELPYGGFDLEVEVVCYDKNRRTVLKGVAYFGFEKTEDGLMGSTRVFVSFPQNLHILVSGRVLDARWLGSEGVVSLDRTNVENEGMSVIQVPMRALANGLIAISSSEGGVVVIDPRRGILRGQWATTAIQDLVASDIVTTSDEIWAEKFFALQGFFYLSQGRVYGRYPLVEINVVDWIDQRFNLRVPIFGGNGDWVYPATRVQVKVLRSETAPAGDVFDLPIRDGSYRFTLPKGTYQIFIEFDGVRDWEQDPNSNSKG